MNKDFFLKELEKTQKKIKEVLGVKAVEYTRNDNIMHNFEVGAGIENTTREEIIWSFALKHFISIKDIRNDLKDGKLPSRAMVEEKYTDLINYLILEKVSILERIGESDKLKGKQYGNTINRIRERVFNCIIKRFKSCTL